MLLKKTKKICYNTQMEYEKIYVNGFCTKDSPRKTNDIYKFLKLYGCSENYIKHLRKQIGYIKLNGENAKTTSLVFDGDVLEICKDPFEPSNIPPCEAPLHIIYEDANYLVVIKPHGMPVIPTFRYLNYNLASIVINYLQKKQPFVTIRILGRLDKDTKGLVLFAKNSIAIQKIKNIEKEYFFVCRGKIENDLIIDKKIETLICDGVNVHKRIVSENGKEAKTYIHVLKIENLLKHKIIKKNDKKIKKINKKIDFLAKKLNFFTKTYPKFIVKTYCTAKIEHGRTHQIRVHLASISHPLIGDELYGEKSSIPLQLICFKLCYFDTFVNKEQVFQLPIVT